MDGVERCRGECREPDIATKFSGMREGLNSDSPRERDSKVSFW